MRYIFIFLTMLTLISCSAKQPESTTAAGIEFKVDKLFTHDGCTVYRFIDSGYYRYFTNCQGSTNWTENCGKNCNKTMNVN